MQDVELKSVRIRVEYSTIQKISFTPYCKDTKYKIKLKIKGRK